MTRDSTRDRLYGLLPSVYRVRDAEREEALRALLGIIEDELRLLDDDIGRLYDNFFIETCEGWVVPYLGDLLGVSGLQPVRDEAFSQRALVANTLAYRRRKGTASVLEQLARDVTGWPAKAVEFFELLATTQHLNHVRPRKGSTVDVRNDYVRPDKGGALDVANVDRLGLVGTPFEGVAHLADVRHIDNGRGRYNIPTVGLFLWRLQPYPVTQGTARAVSEPGDGRYTFSPLGNDAPLFNRPQTETEISQLATERNVSGPLRRRPLYEELEARRSALEEGEEPRGVYFGAQPVLRVLAPRRYLSSSSPRLTNDSGFASVPPEEIEVCHLGDDPSGGWRTPSRRTFRRSDGKGYATRVAVDPELGRLRWLVDPAPKEVRVDYAYGFPGDLGGGSYERRKTLMVPHRGPSRERWEGTVSSEPGRGGYSTLSEALERALETEGDAIITIIDSATYAEEPADAEEIEVELAPGQRLTIQAANGARPVLRIGGARGDLVLGDADSRQVPMRTSPGGQNSSVTLNGLLIEGGVRVENGSLELLRVVHCTLIPGRRLVEDKRPPRPRYPSLAVAGSNRGLRLEIDHSITGHLHLPPEMEGLWVRDSIIDSPTASEQPAIGPNGGGQRFGPPTTLERTTVFGHVHVKELTLASETIFTHPVKAVRRQSGCARFSYVPEGSQTPRRFRCQPAQAIQRELGANPSTTPAARNRIRDRVRARVVPSFTSMRYGEPGYAQLGPTSAEEISTGAEDENEIGAYNFLQQAQRIGSLRTSLDEYLRLSLEAGILLVT